MYKENYKKVRFHVRFGPDSLFERVEFKMKDVKLFTSKDLIFKKELKNAVSQVKYWHN